MRTGPQLGVDAYGVSGFTRSCESASSLPRLSFCTLLRSFTLADAFLLNLALSSRTCSAIAFYTFRI